MMDHEKVNILLVDDQPAKLLAYEVILKELGENLVVASSGREALEYLLKNEVAVILVDVCMPELDGFELAAMIREHPRFQKTAMIFISAIQVSDIDRERSRRHPGRRLHARTRRLRTRGDDPRASTLPEDGNDFHLGDPGQRHRSRTKSPSSWSTSACPNSTASNSRR